MDPLDAVRGYYAAIDDGDYDRLEALLDPGFVQRRPDRTLVGRGAFVGFMRDERPRTDTEHRLDALYRRSDGGGEGTGDDPDGTGDGQGGTDDARDGTEVVARGRLLDADGTELFGFADAFAVAEGRLQSLRTYTA